MKKICMFLLVFMVSIPSFIIGMGMPQMSGGDMQQMQEMEKQLMQEIDQYVSSLSPEEQAEFQKAVEEETKKIESMEPDELNKYIQDTFAGTEPPAATPIEAPKKPEDKKEEPKVISTKLTEKQNNVITLINTLITSIESYIRKINASPDLATKLPKWARQGRIVGWKGSMTFNSFKKELEAFTQQLHKIKKQDAKTKKYTFLPDVIENETLINNLSKLSSTLTHWEPQIILRTLEFQTMNTASKKATIQATNGLLEGLDNLAIPKALDDIIVKYDPEAKKLREEEEKRKKQALESSKRGPQKAPTRPYGTDTTGKASSGYGDYEDYNDYGYGGGYGGYSPYGSGYGSKPSDGSSYQQKQAPRGGSDGYSGGGRSGGATRGSRGNTQLGELSDKGDKDKKGLPKEHATDDKGARAITLSDKSKGLIDSFRGSINDAVKRLESIKFNKPFDFLMSPPKELDQTTMILANTVIKDLESAFNTIYKLASGASVQQKKLYASKLNEVIKDNKEVLNTIIEQINKINKLSANELSKIPDTYRYAYLGGQQADTFTKEAKDAFGKPFDLNELGQLIKKIHTTINTLNSGRALPDKKAAAKSKPAKAPKANV